MWTKLEEAKWTVTDGNGEREAHGVRWQHADGRKALHTPDEDPPLLVLDTEPGVDGMVVREYRPGRARRVAAAKELPLADMQLSRVAAATAADDSPTPETDDEAWALLEGWV